MVPRVSIIERFHGSTVTMRLLGMYIVEYRLGCELRDRKL